MERGRRSLLPRVKRLTHACLKCDFKQLEENFKYQPARKGEKSDYGDDSLLDRRKKNARVRYLNSLGRQCLQNSISNF